MLRRFFFGDSARAFGTVSLLLLVSLVMAVAKDHSSPWRFYQRQYLSLVRGALERGRPRTPFSSRNSTDLAAGSRRGGSLHDMPCGPPGAQPGGYSIEPFRPHPPIPHSLAEFGCVTCHRGQGAATTVEEAHRSTKAWDSRCCLSSISKPPAGNAISARSPDPAIECRAPTAQPVRLRTVSPDQKPDGTTALATDNPPPLAHIAEKTNREWIFAWIKDPQAYFPSATMPNFALSDDDARDLSAAYLPRARHTVLPALQCRCPP